MKSPVLATAIVAGLLLAGWLVLVATYLFAPFSNWSDLGISALTTLHTVRTDCGGVIMSTNYNPLMVGLPAALASIGVAGIGFGLSKRGGSSGGDGVGKAVYVASSNLKAEMAKVLGFVRSHLGSSERYAASLADAQKRLAELDESKQVQVIIKLLQAENERMRLDTTKLKDKLDKSSLHVETLQAKLHEAEEIGLRDPLTLIGNRRCFDEALAREAKSAASQRTPLSLILCDIDHFKNVNDTYGHAVGDEVLKMFAKFLRDSIRDTDTLARFGGEEFGIILPETDAQRAAMLAERIREQCNSKRLMIRKTNQNIGNITASFGVAQLTGDEQVEKFLARVDGKLYEAKRNGRNKVSS